MTYQLVIRGEVGDRFAVLFDGMRFTRRDGLTTLTGRVADQAQLLGLVERAQELGFEILSLQQLPDAAQTASPAGSSSECAHGPAAPIKNFEKGNSVMVDDRVKRIAELIEPGRVKPGSKVTPFQGFDPG